MATTYSSGVVTAYGAALEGGFTGTYADFCQLMATLPTEYGNIEGSIAQPYSSSNTYPNIGTYVWHNGILYKNIVPITTAEEWTAARWTTAEIGRDLINLENIVSATTGNLLPDYNADSWTSPTSVSIKRDGYALIINGTKENAGAVTITDQFVLGAGSYEFGVCAEDSLAGTGAYIQLFADGDVMSQTQTHTSVIVAAEKNVSFRILLNAGAEFNSVAIKPMLFAGSIPNTYVPQVSACDYVVRNNVAQITTELNEKANIDGSYSSLTAGNAEQLVSTVGIEDKVPYNFRTSGGTADIGDRETDMVVGGTVAWNQLVQNGNFASTTGWTAGTIKNGTVTNNILSATATAQNQLVANLFQQSGKPIVGHKMLYTMQVKADSNLVKLFCQGTGTVQPHSGDGKFNTLSRIVEVLSTADKYIGVLDARSSDWTEFQMKNAMVFDLTQMFGESIADYIYSLEQANEGAGTAWFRKLFPNPYYAYATGSLQSVNTSAHKMVGFNAYNNTTGKAKLVGGMQYQITGTYSALSYSTGETLTPDADGYFTPTENGELTITGGNATDTCVHLVWDGEKDGQFEPYEVNSYALDSSLTLHGVPMLDANNNLYYDGDVYESDGTVTKKYEIIDLGVQNWTSSIGGANIFTFSLSDRKYSSDIKAICSRYPFKGTVLQASDIPSNGDKTCCFYYQSGQSYRNFYIYDTSYSTTDDFKTAMSGVYLVYELATPIIETAEPYQNPQIVNDFGTEEYVDAGVTASTPTRDVAIPVGHQTFYQNNLRAKLEMSPDSPDGDGDYIVRQADGENTYVPLVIPTELPANPSEDGTYSLKVTISSGTATLSWVADV